MWTNISPNATEYSAINANRYVGSSGTRRKIRMKTSILRYYVSTVFLVSIKKITNNTSELIS
jgi:hypothetical protein